MIIKRKNGPLAQLVEQLTLNQWVKGSNPLGITKRIIMQGVYRSAFLLFYKLDI